MQRTIRIRNVIGALAAVTVAGVALYIGGGWGIVVLDGAAALVVVVVFLRNMTRGGDGDDGDVGC